MPQQQLERLQAIHRFLDLDIDKDGELQEIVEIAAELLACPISLITLIDEGLQRILYKAGTETGKQLSHSTFSHHPTFNSEIIVVPDILKDDRFVNEASVGGMPGIRFYAGAALHTHDGHQLGSLCIMDTQPKELSIAQQHLLKIMAKRVVQIIEFEMSINLLKNQFLQTKNAESRLRSFFDSSEACHMLIGRSLNIQDFNQHMADLLWKMYETCPAHNVPINQLIPQQALIDFMRNFNIALGGEAVRYQRQVTHRNGEKVWWHVTFLPCYNLDGEVVCVSYNATDITEHTMHKELIIIQKNSLRQIAFIQSHELRKPVATILGLMEVVKMKYSEAMPEEMRMMEEATHELDERIREIVNLTA